MKKRLIIADVKSHSRRGKSFGHYFTLAQNYIDLYGSDYEVKVAGGPVYLTKFSKEQVFELPYDSLAELPAWKQKWRTLMNCRYLFRHTDKNDIIVMQHSAAATFMIGIALFARKINNIYVISYDTMSIASSFKRFWYRLSKRHIQGFLCSNECVAKAFERPYCIIPDYIFAGEEHRIEDISYADKQYDFAILGTIWPDKGVVEAARHLAGTPYKVIIGGKASSEQIEKDLKEACRGAENIDLRIGFVSENDYKLWIRQSRYCMLNYQGTYSERSSGVVLDVLFSGTPIVGHRCFATQFVEDEGCGYLYDDISQFQPQQVMNVQQYTRYVEGISNYLKKQGLYKRKVLEYLGLYKKQEQPENKKRLLIFHPTIAPYRIDIFNDLSKAFNTRMCLLRRGLLSQNFDYDKISSQFEFVPVYAPISKWRTIKFYVHHICDFRPDLIMVHEYGMTAVIAILYRWLTGMKYRIATMCDDSYDMIVNNNDFSQIHKMARRILAPLLDEMVLVEPNVCDWYLSRYGKGVFFPIIRREATIRNAFREALGISRTLVVQHQLQAKKVYLFVGRLVKVKNVDTLIRSFHEAHLTDARLVVVGDGEERKPLERLSQELGENVIFTGRLEGLPLYAWYNVVDCFVLPSTQEPFGAVTNEALVAGCKCLVSQLAGSQCLIENGRNGFTFNPHDKADLTEKLCRINEMLEPHGFETLRDSKMLYDYNYYIQKLVNQLNKTILPPPYKQ